ncbi:MAG: methyltransferase, partial [Pseudomonadota bacterium]
LSAKMLAKAETRQAYDALEKAEFIAYLSPLKEAFDVILAADALCYVGPIEAFSQNAISALTPGGSLVATFEADKEGRDVHLDHTGRYTHGRDYLLSTFAAAGFVDVDCKPEVLRMEQGSPVDGWILTARRPS